MQTTIEDALREEGFLSVAGLDEVGRGPLAGPVCAAAFLLLHAPDVAISEAAVGAALTPLIFIVALRKVKGGSDK